MSRATLTSPTAVAVPASGALGVTLMLVGLQLRPTVTSVGALLADIRHETGMSAETASVLIALPVWCFSSGAWIARHARHRLGTDRSVSGALGLLAAALAARPFGGQLLLLSNTVLASVAIAVLMVLLPAVVQAAPVEHRTGLFTCYAAALGTGSALGALSPLIADMSSWQTATAGWALLAAAALAAWQMWSPAKHVSAPVSSLASRSRLAGIRDLAPARTAWALTVHFGLTLTFSFTIIGWLPSCLRAAHVDPHTVTWLYWVAMTLGVPLAVLLPFWIKRHDDQSAYVVLLAGCGVIGTLGLLVDPLGTAWAIAACVGCAMPAFTVALQLLQLRTGGPDDTAALSAMVNGIGYAIAGTLTLAIGLLHAATGSWHTALLALLVVLAGQIASGITAAHPATVVITPHVVVPHAIHRPN
jgi:MFS transporter, CP family, cyanate transporter